MNSLMKKITRYWLLMAVLIPFLTLTGAAQADDTNWTNYDGYPADWFSPGNWDNNVPTQTTDALINRGGYPSINADGAVARNLTMGSTYRDSGWLDIYNGLTVGEALTVGDAGFGQVSLYGGTLAVAGDLTLGKQYFSLYPAFPQGWLRLYGGNTTVGGKMVVGDAGSGYAQISGGALNVTGDLILGNKSSGYGYLTSPSAVVVGGNMVVGEEGAGNVEANLNVTGNLTLGNKSGSSGSSEAQLPWAAI